MTHSAAGSSVFRLYGWGVSMSDDKRVRELTDSELERLELVRRVAQLELMAPDLSPEQKMVRDWVRRFDALMAVGGVPN